MLPFAFFDFDYSKSVPSQADVYLAIVAVLHSMRTQRRPGREDQSLAQHEHARRLISPRTFERFNDGVVQAAILRAASLAELDYSVAPELGKEMHGVLGHIFESERLPPGEAAPEFLLALAMGRLTLPRNLITDLKNRFQGRAKNLRYVLWSCVGR